MRHPPFEAAGAPLPPNSGHLLPAGHRLLPEPDREGPAMPTHPRHTHAHRTPAQHTHHTHTDPAHNRSRKHSAPQPGTQLTAPSAQLYTVGRHTYRHHTHPSHKHTLGHTLRYTLNLTQNQPVTHTYKYTLTYTLTHMRTLIHSHKYTCSRSCTQIPRHLPEVSTWPHRCLLSPPQL